MASLLIRGFVLGLAIAASPGPIFFLCLRRSLLRGSLTGFVSGLGVATADGFYAGVAVFGVAALSSVLLGIERWLEIAGGLALILLGARSMFEKPKALEARVAVTGAGLAWAYASTLGLTLSNPATIVSFAALAAALGAGLAGGFDRPVAVVAGVAAGSATWWAVLALLVAMVRTRVTPSVARGIGIVSGLLVAALGLAAIVAAIGK